MKNDERKCRVCGCTQNNACPGGCYWVEEDLCSQCAVCEICGHTGKDYDIFKCDGCGKLACDDCGEHFDNSGSFFCKECLAKMTKYDCNKCRNQGTDDCPEDGEYQYCYDCPEYQLTDINKYIEEVHQNAKDHGWWDEPRSMAELLCLIHSEVSEALEEVRDHNEPTKTYYSGKYVVKMEDGSKNFEIISYRSFTPGKAFMKPATGVDVTIDINKPEGIPSELADIVIRVFDICGYYEIDLEAAIKEKMEYNKTRQFKHGGKKI